MSLVRRKNQLHMLVAIVLGLVATALLLFFVRIQSPNSARPLTLPEQVGPAYLYPDKHRTPGAANPEIKQMNINTTLCAADWSTKSVRPPSSYTTALKKRQIREWHLGGGTRDYEEDHLIPLELGGDPTDPRNLWPQRYERPGAHEKDTVETFLRRQVCSGVISLAQAQNMIATDWYKIYLSIP